MLTKLAELRKRAGLKQGELARMVGTNSRTYGAWERNENEMSLAQACALADALDCSLDELVGRPTHEYDDPREAELHKRYGECTEERKNMLLNMARDMAGMSGDVSQSHILRNAK
jgi:transcriptional regulator with XRE-family HTH domain